MTDSNDIQDNRPTGDGWAGALDESADTAVEGRRPAHHAPAGGETETGDGASPALPADDSIFKPLADGPATAAPRDLDMIMEIPVTLSVELGSTRLTIRELLDLAKGSIVELDGLAGEPMNILINGYLIAQGEVVVVDDKYGIRITEIITRAERIQKLSP